MIRQFEAQALHELVVISDFLDHLRRCGRRVGEPRFFPGSDNPDARAPVDGIEAAIELGCGYYERPDALWELRRSGRETPANQYASSSGIEGQLLGRSVGIHGLNVLVRELQRKLDEKARNDYGRTAYLLLDASHDVLGAGLTVDDLNVLIALPAQRRVTSIYLVEPTFTTPRRFAHLAGDL